MITIGPMQQNFERSLVIWDRSITTSLTKSLGSATPRFLPTHLQTHAYHDKQPIDAKLQINVNFIKNRILELEKLLAKIPVSVPEQVGSEQTPFEELRKSGLISESQLNAYLVRMYSYRTKPQISSAIGATKELTEATLSSILEMIAPIEVAEIDFPKLAKQVRNQLEHRMSSNNRSLVGAPTTGLLTGLVTLENNLAGLRNNVGTGHGKAHLPLELSRRHAILARDVAFAYTRFLVLTLEDLGIIALAESD